MKLIKKLLAVLGILVFAMPACNIGIKAPATSDPLSAASTIVAMTLQAQGLPTSPVPSVATPFASLVVVTATTKPTLYINNDNSKCRSGPGPDFKVIASFNKAATVDMIAKDTVDGYWLVKDPASADICWVQAQDATPGGSFDSLPEITPQPSTQGVPAHPTVFYPNYNCDATSLTTTLTWNDVANNENGYRVYRDGSQIADLPANSTTYNETINYTLGTQITYAIEAYNDVGASPQNTLSFHCP